MMSLLLSDFFFFFAMICSLQDLNSLHACLVAQSCLTLCYPMEIQPRDFPHGLQITGSSVLGIFQARILEPGCHSWGSSQPRDQTHISCVSCIGQGFFTTEPPGKCLVPLSGTKSLAQGSESAKSYPLDLGELMLTILAKSLFCLIKASPYLPFVCHCHEISSVHLLSASMCS